MEQKNQIVVTGDTKELVIRTGDAPKVQEPKKYSTTGNIDAVSLYLLTGRAKKEDTVILVDREKMEIVMVAHENNPLATGITGKLVLNPDLNQFLINEIQNGKGEFSRKSLLALVKKTRMFFADREKHAALVSQLMAITVKVNAINTESNNNRGKREDVKNIEAKTDIAIKFKLSIPVFKGLPESNFFVEICYDATDSEIVFWLESVELYEIIESTKKTAIDTEVAKFQGYLVIEQ